MSEVSDETLAELAALAEAATAGPWRHGRRTPSATYYVEPETIAKALGGLVDWMGPADAELIAAARNALPALVAEVQRHRAVMAVVEAAVSKAQEMDKRGPDVWKTGQEHLPPAFREVNWKSAFMALARIVTEVEKALTAARTEAT